MKNKTLSCIILCLLGFAQVPLPGMETPLPPVVNLQMGIPFPEAVTTISQVEYFIDIDPGPGNGNALVFTLHDGQALVDQELTLNNLSAGLHVLYIRFRDTVFGWGPPRGTHILVVDKPPQTYQLQQAEYFIDTDPGVGKGIPISISTPSNQMVITSEINTAGLSLGDHTIYVRFYDSSVGWGPARGTRFRIESGAQSFSIAGAEYFIDTDPGKGDGTPLSAPKDGVFDESNEEFEFSPSLPAEGNHRLYLRLKDNFGRWGPARAVQFTVTAQESPPPTITAAEYYIDTDPGAGAGTAIAAPVDGEFNEAMEEFSADFSVSGLTEGLHRVFIRTKDSRGHWGPARGTYFLVSKDAQPVIVDAEYFFDSDPGPGHGASLPAKDGSYNTTEEMGEITLPVSATGLAVGNHRAYVRFKNSRGDWSSLKYADFSIVVKPVIELSTSSIAFGTVFIGDSAKEEIVIRNRGDANLIISSMTAPTGFKTSFTTAQGTILPNDSLKVTVTFKPTAETNYSGNIVISNNDVQKTIAVSGRGSAVPVSKITITPAAPLDFGRVDIFTEVSKSVQVKITNTGTKKLWISAITSSNLQVFSHDFSGLTDSIAINGYITFHVTFSPKDTIQYSGYLTITNNSPTPNYQYDLRGKGIGTFAPRIVVLKDTLEFGTVQTGTSAIKQLGIANKGTIQLNITSITSTHGDFRTNLSSSNNQVSVGDTGWVNVTFNPMTAGNYDDTLLIYSNDTPHSPTRVRLFGKGSAVPVADLQVSATSLAFGNIKLDAPAVERALTIYNKGTAPLNISNIYTDDPVFTSSVTGSHTISVIGSLNLQVRFQPTASKVYQAKLHIQSDDPDYPDFQVKLTGSSVFPHLFLLTSSLDFGNVPVTTSKDLSITIENDGTDTLKITGFQKSAAISSVIAITPQTYNILPNNSKNFKVTFTPVNPIQYQGEIVINNNDQPDTVQIIGVGIDNVPPAVTYDPIPLANTPVPINNAISISATVSDNNIVEWVRLYYRKAGFASYDSLTMTKNGSGYSGNIPAARVTERGVEYYIRAFDGANYQMVPSTAPAVPAIVRVVIPSLPPKTTLAEKYEMFSVPSELNHKKVSDLLEQAIGPYDINLYRVFRWVNGAYVELKDNPNFTLDPGNAYWLITAGQKVINLDTSISVKTDEPFELNLYQGWNQVGTPFYFPVDWSDVISASGSGVIQGGVAFEYDGTGWAHATILDPFKGYFIYTPSSGNNLKIPAREATIPKKKAVTQMPAQPGEWIITIQALTQEFTDRANYVGMLYGADDEWDILDVPDPPTPSKSWVNIYFNHQSWSHCAGNYSADYKAVNPDGCCFDFTLTAQGCREKIILKLTPTTNLPPDFNYYLVDLNRRVMEKVDPNGEALLTPVNGKLNRQYRLMVGTTGYLQERIASIGTIPSNFALRQNYPNPFNPRTFISYQLPEPCLVTLAVYNTLGQRVRTFAWEEFKYPGYYQVIWQGENDEGKLLPSGVYWYSIRAGQFQHTRKMLFIK